MDAEFLKYHFEDGFEGVVVKKGFKIGFRHVQILYMFVSSIVLGSIRGTNGVVVLSISDEMRRNDTYIKIHNWDRKTQGITLSSFFFGYALLVFPAELFVKKIGGKLVMTTVLVVNGALCCAMPTIVNKGGWIAFSNAQLLMGMTHSCLAPTLQLLVNNWLPPYEKKIFSPIVHGGVILGIVISLPVAGKLSQAPLGWELLFYSQAIIGLSMAAMWGLLTSSSPEKNEIIGDSEKEFIRDSFRYYFKKTLKVPWAKIVMSPQFWALTFAHAASNVLFTFYLVDAPAYLMSFKVPLKDAITLSSLPFVFFWLVYLTTAPCIEWLHRTDCITYVLSLTHFRKIINALGALGVILGLTILSFLGPHSIQLALVILIGIFGSLGFQFCGFLENHKDLSQDFSGTVLTLSCSVSALFAVVESLVSGFIIGDDIANLNRWRILLVAIASFTVACNILYNVFGSSETQDWTNSKKKFGYNNVKLLKIVPKVIDVAVQLKCRSKSMLTKDNRIIEMELEELETTVFSNKHGFDNQVL